MKTRATRDTDSARGAFEREGYLIVPQLVDVARARRLCAAQRELDVQGWYQGDGMVPGAFARYGAPPGQQLLSDLRHELSALIGLALLPTYSYLRIYHRGDILHRHRDRRACDVSVSITLDQNCVRPWPLWIAGRCATRPIRLAPGDGVIYRGIECAHWRTQFRGRWQCQLFLHYVDAHGPHAFWENDRRERVGATLIRRGPTASRRRKVER